VTRRPRFKLWVLREEILLVFLNLRGEKHYLQSTTEREIQIALKFTWQLEMTPRERRPMIRAMKSASSEGGEQSVDVWNAHFARLEIQSRHNATRTGSLRQVLLPLPISRHHEYNQRRKFHEVF
jgi:hypothetical protein